MHPGKRHQFILDLLEKDGSVKVADLSRHLHVTEITIRRDLDTMERWGLIRRVRGGAVTSRGRSYEPPFFTRAQHLSGEKERIGKAAADLIRDGDSIALDVGSTTLEVARQLAHRHNLTVITPSFHIAAVLAEQHNIRLILTGGILRPGELSMTGSLAEQSFKEFHVDKLILGIGGIDLYAGLTEFNLEDALVKKAMIKSSKEVIVAADATKFGRIAFAAVAGLDVAGRIITDSSLDPNIRSRFETSGVAITIV